MATPIDELKEEYKFMKIWPQYTDPRENGSYHTIGDNDGKAFRHEIWMNFLRWYYDKNGYYNYLHKSDLSSFKEPFKSVLAGTYRQNEKLNDILYDTSSLKDLLKLYYFGRNSGNIQKLLENQEGPLYKDACQFVNECLHIFRDLKKKYCTKGTPTDFSGNAVCNQLGEFMDKYEHRLYEPLKKHNKMSSLLKNPESARVRCDVSESLYYTPFFSIYKSNSDEFSTFGTLVTGGFAMFAVYLIVLILYKFTPLGLRFQPEGRRNTRRVWRNMDRDYHGSFSTLSSFSDDSESVSSDNDSYVFTHPIPRYY
ncbi:VIR protein [Plasmodium vivax]|uniref:VIR protein n=1 Tax=Plasmodium vivax TaxID=5855 RepID=A0A1G4H6N9_PLAVI|nr:VIR protein [Plasmodium vivax]